MGKKWVADPFGAELFENGDVNKIELLRVKRVVLLR